MIDKSNWSPGNLMWVAGLLEGEGSFLVYVVQKSKLVIPSVQLSVKCKMTDEDVIKKLHKFAGSGMLEVRTFSHFPQRN